MLVLSVGLATALVGARPSDDKSIFVSALDESGRPVKDLTASELRIREDGADREIVSVAPATEPLQIALLADTTAAASDLIRDIRTSLASFIRRVHTTSPDTPISLIEFGQAAVTIVPFVTTTDLLDGAVHRLVGRPAAASVLLEAIIQANLNLLKRPSPRRAIVSVNIEPSNEQSREDPQKINDALRSSGAQLWAVSLHKGTLRNPARDVVLNALTKNSGGNREFIVAPSALEGVLDGYADALTFQYKVTYRRPGSGARVVQVGSTRQNLRLHASGYPPR